MSALFANPFSPAAGAQVTGPAGNSDPTNQRSPSGANAGNPNSGTNPTGNTGNNQVNPDPNNPANGAGTIPNNNNPQGNDPMADLSKLWETTPVDPKNPNPTPVKYVPDIDPKALGETVGKMDFTKSVSAEQRAAMLAGGEAGLTAMFDVINSVGRQAVATTYQAGQKMMSSALERAEAGFMEKVPNQVRNANTDSHLASNPLVNNPAYAPLVANVKNQFLDKFPKASPEQVGAAVNKYFDKMVADATGAKNQTTQADNSQKLRTGSGDADWMEWAASEIGGVKQ